MESGPYPGNIKNRIKKEIHIPAGRPPFVFCHEMCIRDSSGCYENDE